MPRPWLIVVAVGLVATVATLPVPVGAVPPTRVAGTVATTTTPAGQLRSETIPVAGGRARAARPAPGWTTQVAVAPGTTMVGLSWTGPAHVDLELRGRTGTGPWSEWVDLHADLPDGEEGRFGAGPAWLGQPGVDTVAVRVVEGSPATLDVVAMDFTPGRARAARALDVSATPAGGPPIRTRADWAPGGWQAGHPGCTPRPPVMDQVRFAVVHHTVSSNSYSQGDVPGILAGMYRFHTASNGWCDIAYNYFVDRFGGVWQGRTGSLHSPIMGGHARGFNTHSVGVALLGQHQPGARPAAATPSAAAMTGLRDLLAWKLAANDIDPGATIGIVSQGSPRYPAGRRVELPTIQGHRDSGLTSCPGELTYARLAQLRLDVAARIRATATPDRWAPASTGLAFFDRIMDDVTGRDSPPGEAGRKTSLVVRAGLARDGIVHDVVFAPATDTRIGVIDRLYQAAFTRIPDRAGLAFWVGERDRGRPNWWFSGAFSESAEFRARYDHLGNGAFAEALYHNVLGRVSDSSGLAYWTSRLDAGTSRGEVLGHFSESAENIWITHTRTKVTRAYFSLLRRGPFASDHAYWAQRFADGGTNLELVRVILFSDEYARGARVP